MCNSEEDFDAIYETIIGSLKPEYRLDWVKNSFVEGTRLYDEYEILWDALEKLGWRMGLEYPLEDPDIGHALGAVTAIKRIIAREMFHYTLEYVRRDYQI